MQPFIKGGKKITISDTAELSRSPYLVLLLRSIYGRIIFCVKEIFASFVSSIGRALFVLGRRARNIKVCPGIK